MNIGLRRVRYDDNVTDYKLPNNEWVLGVATKGYEYYPTASILRSVFRTNHIALRLI